MNRQPEKPARETNLHETKEGKCCSSWVTEGLVKDDSAEAKGEKGWQGLDNDNDPELSEGWKDCHKAKQSYDSENRCGFCTHGSEELIARLDYYFTILYLIRS
ncbi:MAG: hypothetical protein AB8E87_12420 [Prochlorococcus sp.]